MRDLSWTATLYVGCIAVFAGNACFSAGSSPEDSISADTGVAADGVSDADTDTVDARADATDGEPDTAPDTTADATRDVSGCEPECSAPQGTDRVVAECRSGSCELRCEAGWVDSDNDLENGCELECEETNGGTEICDGVDNDCDGNVDEDFRTGGCTVGTGACEKSGTYQCVSDDEAECSAEAGEPSDETCGDDVDNDCDGDTDEGDAVDATTWYADTDGDGFGDPDNTMQACAKPNGFVANDRDCNDADGAVKPREFYEDQDGDTYTTGTSVTRCRGANPPNGFASSKSSETDCNDMDSDVHPGAVESCDGNDTDCDGTIDNIPQGGSRGTVFYVDCDGDSFAATTVGSRRACPGTGPRMAPSGCSTSNPGWTETDPNNESDCNDNEPKANPDQTKSFDNPMTNAGSARVDKWDYDCDGSVDEEWDTSKCSVDSGCSDGFSAVPPPRCGNEGDFFSCNSECCTSQCSSLCDTCSNTTTRKKQRCK